MISIEHLSVRFRATSGPVLAVDDVSLDIGDGEAVGLVGESGSGKSTVLRVVAGLIPEASGIVRLDGRQVGIRRDPAQRKLVQMVFQDPYGSLHPNHTVDRILAEPARIQGFTDVAERIVKALTEVGLGPQHRFRFPHQLSGGQRQRVAIARALIVEPRALLLDEPTSALDVSVQAEILNLLTRLRRSHGLTLLMVSHDLAVVAHLCDRVAVMTRGRIVERLSVADLRAGVAQHAYTQELLAESVRVG
jgi:peptide/nickel transport system ATP-binding protein